MGYLDQLLTFPARRGSSERTPLPPRGAQILCTDTLDAPASFVLLHFAQAALALKPSLQDSSAGPSRPTKHAKVVWVGANAQGEVHWRAVARKAGLNLELEAQRGRCCYLDATSVLLSGDGSSRLTAGKRRSAPSSLRQLYAQIAAEITTAQDASLEEETGAWNPRAIVIVDDLSALAWAMPTFEERSDGQHDSAQEIIRWIFAVRALCERHSAVLITSMHADASSATATGGANDTTDEILLRALARTSDLWIEVRELSSGRARDCSGEIAIHPLARPSLAASLHRSSTVSASPAASPNIVAQRMESLEGRKNVDSAPLEAFALDTSAAGRPRAMLYRLAPDGAGAAGGGERGVQIWARGSGRGFL